MYVNIYKKIGKCLIFFIKIIPCELRLFKQLTIQDFVIKAVSKDMFVIQESPIVSLIVSITSTMNKWPYKKGVLGRGEI